MQSTIRKQLIAMKRTKVFERITSSYDRMGMRARDLPDQPFFSSNKGMEIKYGMKFLTLISFTYVHNVLTEVSMSKIFVGFKYLL